MKPKILKLFFLVCVLGAYSINAQTVNGTITDAKDGTSLPGVNVVIKGTKVGVSSDFNGNYSINVKNNNAILQFSYLGYITKDISIKGRKIINVKLTENTQTLNEVVITALGIKSERKSLGYAVTQVKGTEVSLVKSTNAINALEGKIAGVNITSNATGAGGSSRVIIRGNTSLTGNNQPLYVVDGISIGNDNNGSAGMWGGSDGGDGISSINPDDGASISVLKGGPAAALYGSRASNGVILITTKSGKTNEGLGVEYSQSTTIEQINTKVQDFQKTYGQGINGAKPVSQQIALDNPFQSWGAKLDGSSVMNWDGTSRPYSYVGNNLKKFYRTGSTFINTVAISGGNETTNFRFSASDLENKDIIPNSDLNRKSFSLNVGTVVKKKLTFNANVNYTMERVHNRPRLSDAPGNANFSVGLLPANVDVTTMKPGQNADGTELRISSGSFTQNPYWSALNFRNGDQRNRIIASSTIKYNFFDWLYIKARAGVDSYTRRSTSVTPWGTAYQPEGSMNENERRYTQTDADLILGFEKDINKKISINSFIGGNNNAQTRENLGLYGGKFIVPNLETVKNTKEQSTNYSYGKQKINSIYGSIQGSYNKAIYLTITGRNDWFSTLSAPGKTTPNNDFYYSANTSIILSDLLKLPDWVSFAKLRGGYSKLAGGAPNPYSLGLSYGIVDQGHLGQPLGDITNGSIPNPNLTPFNVNETELGLNTSVFKNRLSLDFSYYSKKTTNDIVAVNASETSGYGSSIVNLGEITNRGVEILLSGTPIINDNLTWTSTFNFAYNKSRIVATNATGSEIGLGQARSRNVEIRHIVGQPYGVIVGTSYVRDANGTIMYDIGTDGIPRATIGNFKQIGKGVPPFSMGLNNSVTYKNFNLSFLIDAKYGGDIFSGTNTISTSDGLNKLTLKGRETGLSVSGINAATGQPFTTTVAPKDLATYWGRISGIAEQFVSSANFIKFRQVALSYNFPSKYLSKTFLTDARISFIGRNLFYLYRSVKNIAPEAAYNTGNAQGLEYFGLPTTTTYGFSLNVKF